MVSGSGVGVGVGLGVGVGVGMTFEVDDGVGLGVAFEVDGTADLDVGLEVGLGGGLGVTLDVGLTLRCSMFQLMLYWGGGELVCTSFVDVDFWVDDGLGLVVDLKVVGLGGHGFQGGYPGLLVEVGLLVGTEEEVCLEVLELVETDGDDVTDGYSGVGLGVGVGTGVGVEAPGPSPSQLML